MQKLPLRPLRLIHFNFKQPALFSLYETTDGNGETIGNEAGDNHGSDDRLFHDKHRIPDETAIMLPNVSKSELPRGDVQAQLLLKRTPNSYIFNQIYGLWFYISWFLLTVIITRTVSTSQYGIFAVALTAFNTILYIVAFGLEDATTTFVPRVFAERGHAAAALLIRRLLALRVGILALTTLMIICGLPILAALIALVPIQGSAAVAASLRDPVLLSHSIPIAIYILGSGITNLLSSVCAALMRMQLVLVIGSITQFVLLALGFFVLQLGWGINGILWLLAITSVLNAAAFALWQASFLLMQGAEYKQPLKPVLQLGISAWLTNLASGALLKQISIILLGLFAVSLVNIGYFNLSFQLADSANLLLVAGFAGVGGSALAAAFVGKNNERLAFSWQALIKVETLLAAPGLIFCLFNASNIAHALYGSQFDPVGPLLAIFLFFNMLVRILGTTIHQASLYVIGRPQVVVLSQWIGLLTVLLFGVALIPSLGPAGALIADGIAKTVTGALLLFFLLRDLPRKYPLELLGFTLRFLLALVIAALPSILWHPSDRLQLGASGVVFIVLCVIILLLIKPLSGADLQMITVINPRLARLLRRFVRY